MEYNSTRSPAAPIFRYQEIGCHMKKLFKGTGFLFRENGKELYQEPSFIDEWIHRNLYFCFSAALLLSLLSAIELAGVYAPREAGQILPQINATFVYATLLACNMISAVLISAAIATYSKGSKNTKKHTTLLRLYRASGMILASFTFFSTEKGSSFFFEYILVSMIIYLLPLYDFKETLINTTVNIGALAVIFTLIDHPIAWQDQADLFAFHMFCITISRLRWNSYVRYESVRIHLIRHEAVLTGEVRRDGLTGLLNRTALRNDFPEFLSKEICLALLDIDSFKHLNDTYGHVYGDRVLSFIGRNMMTVFSQPEDRCYRYGGDEMMIISITHDANEFRRRLEKMQQLSRKSSPEIRVEISIGYCCGFPLSEADLRSCIQIADACLYQVKNHPDGQRIAGDRMKMNRKTAGRPVAALESLPSFSSLEPRFQELVGKDRAVVFLDICRFTELNERFGYRKGNWILERMAEQLLNRFPRMDLANPDSDHFVLISTLPEKEIESRIAAVQRDVEKLIPSCSIQFRTGICRCPDGDQETSFMTAFYNAKYTCSSSNATAPGRGGICLYDSRMAEIQIWDDFVRDHLDEALEKGLIIPFYQPFIGSLSRKTCGFEALARWTDPEKGLISPADFIPALETQRKTYRLDLYMLKQVCEALKQNRALVSDDLFITINLSRTDFGMTDMPEEIDRILAPYGFAKDLIQFEITESAMNDGDLVRNAVAALERKGYRFWLDDFGVGESSLHALQDYSVRGVKLDQSFLSSLRDNGKSPVIIRSIVDMCHRTGCLMIAEGVEDPDQFWHARQWGVNFMQGFLLSRPLPLDDLMKSRFIEEITDENDVAFYRPAANINLSVPIEPGFYAPDQPKLVFAKAVVERDQDRISFMRLTREMLSLFQPYFRKTDLDQELAGGTPVHKMLLSFLKQADSKPGVLEFAYQLGGRQLHGQIVCLTGSGERRTYIFATSDYGIANPVSFDSPDKDGPDGSASVLSSRSSGTPTPDHSSRKLKSSRRVPRNESRDRASDTASDRP